MPELILALDVGTTSLRAALFSPDGALSGLDRRRLATQAPSPGRLTQDPAAVWRGALAAMRGALAAAGREARDLAAIGVTTQRTSALVWDRATGRPLSPLVLWSDLSGAERAAELREQGFFVAPQQAAAKLEAILAGAAAPGARGLAWGALDSWLIARLSGGAAHVTDRSQAWPTGYLDLSSMGWNAALIAHQRLDPALFPRLVDTWGPIAETDRRVLGAAVPITADVADQQAALIAHGAEAGVVKATFGTSATLDLATGAELVLRDLATPPFVLSSAGGETRFCLEGMVYSAGAALDWLRAAARLGAPAAFDALAATVADAGGAWFLPALAGLGAPYADASRRGALGGLSLATTRAQIARAGLEGVAFRTREVFDHLHAITGRDPPAALNVDGGLSGSDVFLGVLAEALGRPVRRHALREATAAGAALAAARGAGLLAPASAGGFVRYDPLIEPRSALGAADARFAAWKHAAYGAS
jgi:glycerol kinase